MISLSLILKQCITLNAQAQDIRPFPKTGMTPQQYRRECKSIFLDVGRQTGKTTTIIDFYKPGDLVIVHSMDRATYFPRHMNVVSHQRFFDDISRRGDARIDTERNYIFIDEPFNVTPQNMETLYHTTDAALYIFLGKFR